METKVTSSVGRPTVRNIDRKAALSTEHQKPRQAVLFDRLPLWLEAVAGVVMKAGVEVVAKTTSPSVALRLIDQFEPDLFILGDVENDARDVLDCLRRAQSKHAGLRTIVLSERSDATYIEEALAAGAKAFVTKSAHPEDLSSAVRQAFEVSVYLQTRPASATQVQSHERGLLTRRELEILALAAQGASNAAIARTLWVTQQTVKFHLSNIYRKLEVSNRTEAARWAHLHGVGSDQVLRSAVA
jgi:DNA-binding NarL/FixJ family response regulator